MKLNWRIAGLLPSLLAIVALSDGCAGSNLTSRTAANGGKIFAIASDSAPFYRYGPQQANGPDKKLPKDTLLTLIRGTFGYCKVRLTTGEEGFVASEDIHAASPALIAAATAPPTASSAAARFRSDPSDPRFAPPPRAPLPEFEPTPIPVPPNFSN
jgi:hypothetical protein